MTEKDEDGRDIGSVEKPIQDNQLSSEEYDIHFETDEAILFKINQRKEENKALKKLLENLNTSMPIHKSKKEIE